MADVLWVIVASLVGGALGRGAYDFVAGLAKAHRWELKQARRASHQRAKELQWFPPGHDFWRGRSDAPPSE